MKMLSGSEALTGGEVREREGHVLRVGLVEEVDVVVVEADVAFPLDPAAVDEERDRLITEEAGGQEVPGGRGARAREGVAGAAIADDRLGRDEAVRPAGLALANRDVVGVAVVAVGRRVGADVRVLRRALEGGVPGRLRADLRAGRIVELVRVVELDLALASAGFMKISVLSEPLKIIMLKMCRVRSFWTSLPTVPVRTKLPLSMRLGSG
jgi:hypothetical protein